ncbi:hypothetical protein L3Q82_013009 [Scortum barcoo]|uniref:Uncharacterized protein n=1 Tax=Scortum barcoo TaxID=214431 RepID=A0ACB8VZC5_9TELE|nr:hypothetical protein L3Q82_013009 [Scortum barcoo]
MIECVLATRGTADVLVVSRQDVSSVTVANTSKHDLILSPHTILGHLEEIKAVYPITVESSDETVETTLETMLPIQLNEVTNNPQHNCKPPQLDPPVKLDHLSSDQEQRVRQVLREECHAFAYDDKDVGCIPTLNMHITLHDTTPVRKTYISVSETSAPRKNSIENLYQTGTRFPEFRIRWTPCMESSWFSVLDQGKAYHQGFLVPESRPLTAFITPWGLYQWNRKPFGLSSAPAEFQRSMEDCLKGLRDVTCQPYLDDNLVHSPSFDSHVDQIRPVLQQYQKHGVKLSPQKCDVFKRRVRFLGRMISEEGYTMDPAEIAPVQALKHQPPSTVGELS